jgi:hypothetical protein
MKLSSNRHCTCKIAWHGMHSLWKQQLLWAAETTFAATICPSEYWRLGTGLLLAHTHRLLINVVLHSFPVSLSFNLWLAVSFTINEKYKGHTVCMVQPWLLSSMRLSCGPASRNTMVAVTFRIFSVWNGQHKTAKPNLASCCSYFLVMICKWLFN